MRTNSHLESRISKLSPGFTFIEILFAVIILGIGMIMIAGMLPVAIKQNADTRNDVSANAVAQNGYAYLKTLIQTHPEAFPETSGKKTTSAGLSIPNMVGSSFFEDFMEDKAMGLDNNDEYTINGGFPENQPAATVRRAGRVVPLTYDVIRPDNSNPYNLSQASQAQRDGYPLMWHQSILADRISTGDPRFQWMAFYRRDEGSKTVKLIIVAMRHQNTDALAGYDAAKTLSRELLQGNSTFDAKSNGPFLVPVQIEDGLVEPDKITFAGANGADLQVAQTGAFVIIAHSPPLSEKADSDASPGDLNRPFRNNGRVFRLGAKREDIDPNGRVWDLQPGFDLAPAGPGADGIMGTNDDIADGSMNETPIAQQIMTDDRALRPSGLGASVNQVNVGGKLVSGKPAWAWIIGKERNDPSSPNAVPFIGLPQDIAVLQVDVPLP